MIPEDNGSRALDRHYNSNISGTKPLNRRVLNPQLPLQSSEADMSFRLGIAATDVVFLRLETRETRRKFSRTGHMKATHVADAMPPLTISADRASAQYLLLHVGEFG